MSINSHLFGWRSESGCSEDCQGVHVQLLDINDRSIAYVPAEWSFTYDGEAGTMVVHFAGEAQPLNKVINPDIARRAQGIRFEPTSRGVR